MELGGVKTVRDLSLLAVWADPDHRAATARVLLDGHRISHLAVMNGDELAGLITYRELVGASDSSAVSELMGPPPPKVDIEQPLRSVAQLMVTEGVDAIAAFDGKKFAGLIGAPMLLKEMARTWDPLTGLSWSDHLREWGVERLKEGRDVTIIFVDLDDFGQYNKKYGHVVGDRVLQKVARYLKDSVDESTDILVRFGGDEFAIATIRSRAEAESMVDSIHFRVAGTFIGEAEQPVSISIGIFGGRRTHERDNIHFAATLDSLINLASRDCMAKKASKKSGVSAAESEALSEASGEFRVTEVYSGDSSKRGVAMVTIEHGGEVYRGVHARSQEMSPSEAVARATLWALERAIPDVRLSIEGFEETANTVAIAGEAEADGKVSRFTVDSKIDGDRYWHIAKSTLEAAKSALE